jgi:hypothetical protein
MSASHMVGNPKVVQSRHHELGNGKLTTGLLSGQASKERASRDNAFGLGNKQLLDVDRHFG